MFLIQIRADTGSISTRGKFHPVCSTWIRWEVKEKKEETFFVGFKFYLQTLSILLKTIPYCAWEVQRLSHPAGAELWGGWASAWRRVNSRAELVVAHVLPSAMAAWSQGRHRESFTCRLAITAS